MRGIAVRHGGLVHWLLFVDAESARHYAAVLRGGTRCGLTAVCGASYRDFRDRHPSTSARRVTCMACLCQVSPEQEMT